MLCRCQLLSITLLLLVAHTKTLERMDRILIKVHFLLFSRRCILTITAGLLEFVLHRVFSIGFVKIVCCHNAIPHTLRGELTCARFRLYIWRLNLKQTLSFTSLFKTRLVLTLTKEIIIQSEPEKEDKNQSSAKLFYTT